MAVLTHGVSAAIRCFGAVREYAGDYGRTGAALRQFPSAPSARRVAGFLSAQANTTMSSAEIAARIAGYVPLEELLRRFDAAAAAEGVANPTLPVDAIVALLGDSDAGRHAGSYVPRGLSRADARRLALAAAKHYRVGVVKRVLDDAACGGAGGGELSRLAVDVVAPLRCDQRAGVIARSLVWLACVGRRPRGARRALVAAAAALHADHPHYRGHGPAFAGLMAIAALLGREAAARAAATRRTQVGPGTGGAAEAVVATGGPAAARRVLAREGGASAPRVSAGDAWGFIYETDRLHILSGAEFIRRRHRMAARNLVAFRRWRAAALVASSGVLKSRDLLCAGLR